MFEGEIWDSLLQQGLDIAIEEKKLEDVSCKREIMEDHKLVSMWSNPMND